MDIWMKKTLTDYYDVVGISTSKDVALMEINPGSAKLTELQFDLWRSNILKLVTIH